MAHDATVTIWDTANAPAGTVTESPDTNGCGSCTLTPFGGETCESTSGVLRPNPRRLERRVHDERKHDDVRGFEYGPGR